VTISFQEAFKGTERSFQSDSRRIEVKIPAGARTGTKVRVPGAGPDQGGGQRGDLFLLIEVTPDSHFDRQEDDLYTEVPIDLYTAVLGGKVNVPTPGGTVSLTIPAGTQPGQTFRLAGRGMPHLKVAQTFGDLYAKIKIQIPRQLDPQQKKLFEQLRGS
jgi:DnaJ-class molecular chaperone